MDMLKENKIKWLIITFLLMVMVSLTYSKFSSMGKLKIESNVALWSIKVNGQDVTSSSSFTLNNIVWSGSETVANGYVAPGGSGYYEIVIDTSGTKVAIDYMIGFDSSILEQNTRMKVDRVTFDGVEKTSEDGYYDGFISLSDVLDNKLVTIRIYINWDEANNEEDENFDVQSALNYKKIELPMVVMVRQHIDNADSSSTLIPQLISFKESLLEVERPTVTVAPFYTSSLDALYQNPERGFYNTNILNLSKSGNTVSDMQSRVSKLLYLKVDLSAFSAWRNGTDIELTEDAINTLKAQLENIKQHNNTVILRFVYDNGATTIVSNLAKFEPQQEMLVRHIEQLKSVFQEYQDTIYTIQVGFYGLWGESYYNTDVNSHPEYYKQTMESLLEATEDTEIIIAFRTPSYIQKWVEESEYDTSRVGIFNDAYLSQNDDMGTYINRTEEIKWLSKRNTSYGGETLPATFTDSSEKTSAYEAYYNNSVLLDEYVNFLKTKTQNWDLIRYTEEEMFQTHTSYLNFEWNQYKHYIWANQSYNGKDELYHGKTALEYVQNHLGYRLVLRSVELPRTANSKEEIAANITVENVGFGNVLKSKTATLLFVDTNNQVVGTVDVTNQFDVKSFTSTNKVKKSLNFSLPELPSGMYRVFLRVSNKEKLNDGSYYSAIRFANTNVWEDMLQANRIGSIKIN